MTEAIVSILILGGSLFVLAGSIGLLRFPCFYSRVHAVSLASTAGLGLLIIGEVLHFTFLGGGFSFKGLLVLAFILLTTPVSAHALGRAAYKIGTSCGTPPVIDEYAARKATSTDTLSAASSPEKEHSNELVP